MPGRLWHKFFLWDFFLQNDHILSDLGIIKEWSAGHSPLTQKTMIRSLLSRIARKLTGSRQPAPAVAAPAPAVVNLYLDPEAMAIAILKAPRILSEPEARTLRDGYAMLNLTICRKALKAAASAAGRDIVTRGETMIGDRVYHKASTRRLYYWAQNKNCQE